MNIRSRLLLATLILGLPLVVPAVPHLGARAAAPTAGPSLLRFPPGSLALYKLAPQGTGLRALDPRSLSDLSQQRLLTLWPRQAVGNGTTPSIAVTPNGARFAVLRTTSRPNHTPGARDMTLQLFDARTGRALSVLHHPAIPFWLMSISADGSRLFGTRSDINLNEPCATTSFYVLDTPTGRMLHRIRGYVTWSWEPFQTDVALHRLYVFSAPDQTNGCGAWSGPTPTVASYSLTTGKLLARVRLTRVLAGVWPTHRLVNQQTVMEVQNPGFALSPDGTQLAVLDGANDSLTLLNARSMAVETTERLVRPTTLLDSVRDALGLAPAAAEAKGEEDGFSLHVQYTADGRSLLVAGTRIRPGPHHRFSTAAPLPLRLVDIATGRIRAQLATRKQIDRLWSAPDGSAVYSLVPGGGTQQLCPCTLRRHDPATLKITASRTFQDDSGLQFYVLQAPQIERQVR